MSDRTLLYRDLFRMPRHPVANRRSARQILGDAIVRRWAEVVGPMVATKTRVSNYGRGKLVVYVTNEALMRTLASDQSLVEKLRCRLPVELRAIRFKVGR